MRIETLGPNGEATLYLGDCFEILPKLEGVDAVVTDPEYGINAPSMTLGKGKKTFYRGEWDKKPSVIHPLINIGEKHMFFGGNYFSDQLPPTNDWLIWHKKNDGRSFSEFEMAWSDFGCNTRLLSHHWGGEEKLHPTQKPLAVMQWCLSFIPNATTILDPFMGSGTTGVACANLGRRFIGIAIEPKYFDIACRRISDAYAQPRLFDDEPQLTPVQGDLLEVAT